MPFSLYRLEGEKYMSICITAQIKPLWALLKLPVPAAVNHLSCQVCEILGSLEQQYVNLSGSPRDSEHIHGCLSACSGLPALQVSWVGCHTYFHLPSLRFLSVSDKIVLFFQQIHGTLVTSSDRFCWKVFFLLEWWERNAGTLLMVPLTASAGEFELSLEIRLPNHIVLIALRQLGFVLGFSIFNV